MNEDMRSLITRERVLLAVASLLAILVPVWLLSDQTETVDPSPIIGATSFKSVAIEQPADIVTAPLFNADRETPPVDELDGNATQAISATPAAAVPSLVGLIVGHGMPGLALARGADGQTHLLHVGDMIDGWQVATITTSGASFDLNGHQEHVGLNFAKAAGTSPPTANAPQASPPPESPKDKPSFPAQPIPPGTE